MKVNKKAFGLAILFFFAETLKTEFFFGLMILLICVKAMRNNIPRKILNISRNFIIILVLGIIGGLIYISKGQYQVRDYFRDIVRVGMPIIFISFGIISFKSVKSKILVYKSIVYGGVLLSIRHFVLIILNISSVFSQGYSRGIGGMQSETTILALIILLFSSKDDMEFIVKGKLKKYFMIIFLIISDLLYFSRTDIVTFLCFLILFLCCKFVEFFKNGINISKTIKVMVIIFITIGIGYVVIPKQPLNILINKFSNTINEISANKDRNWTYSDINEDWRGFEVYRAKLEYGNANLSQKFVGFGFGKKISLGLSMKLGATLYSEIPILHNGYWYLLIKTGCVGIILFLLFIFKNFAYSFFKMLNSKNQLEYMLISGSCLAIALSTYTITGAFNSSISFPFFVVYGYMYSYFNKNTK